MGGHCLFPTILAGDKEWGGHSLFPTKQVGDKQWGGATLCFLLKHRKTIINSVIFYQPNYIRSVACKNTLHLPAMFYASKNNFIFSCVLFCFYTI